jgi:hypothetical protein
MNPVLLVLGGVIRAVGLPAIPQSGIARPKERSARLINHSRPARAIDYGNPGDFGNLTVTAVTCAFTCMHRTLAKDRSRRCPKTLQPSRP